MKYSHLRDDEGSLLATIAYEEIEDGVSAYGVTIVSDTEPENAVQTAIGRLKAKCRCEAAKNGNSSNWRDYGSVMRCGDADCNELFRDIVKRFMKLGRMKSKKLRNRIKELRINGEAI